MISPYIFLIILGMISVLVGIAGYVNERDDHISNEDKQAGLLLRVLLYVDRFIFWGLLLACFILFKLTNF